MTKNMYILVGPPGSGKSTWIEKEFQNGCFVISSDHIIEDIAQGENKTYDEVLGMVTEAMDSGKIKGNDRWVSWLLQNGLMLNDSIGTLARGGMLINQLPKLVGDEEIIFDEQVKMGAREYFHALADRDVDYPLQFKDSLQIGRRYISNTCSGLLQSIFSRR